MALIDVHGYCPACGQDALHLSTNTNLLCCINQDCPRPATASELLRDPEVEHILVMERSPRGFSLKHPLRERINDELLSCEVGQYVGEFWDIMLQHRQPGADGVELEPVWATDTRYRVWMDGEGEDRMLQGEPA